MKSWSEKYRPVDETTFVWPDEKTRKLINSWTKNPLSNPHLLLHGPTGTGKTTLAKMIAKKLTDQADHRFFYASIDSGVDFIRDVVVPYCQSGSLKDYKIVILDEADRLSGEAQNALRNVLDRYNDFVRFILTCNHVNRITDPIIGRCWSVEINAMDTEKAVDFASSIWEIETGTPAGEVVIKTIKKNLPNMRQAINEIQKIHDGAEGAVDVADIESVIQLSVLPPDKMYRKIVSMTHPDLVRIIEVIAENLDSFSEDNARHVVHRLATTAYRIHNTDLAAVVMTDFMLWFQEMLEEEARSSES